MLRTVRRSLLFGVMALSVACGGGDKTPTGPSGGSHGTLTAIIDGVAYSGIVNTATNTNNTLRVSTNSADLKVSLNFAATPAAVGSINVATSTTSMNVLTTNGSTTTGSWIATVNTGSGTLTISNLSATGASGTFAFTAPPANATTPPGNKVVTTGVFNVTF